MNYPLQLSLHSVVTALLLMCKYTAHSWLSSLGHQPSALFVTRICPIYLYTIKKFTTVSSLLSSGISYEHIHLTRKRKKIYSSISLFTWSVNQPEGTMQVPMLPPRIWKIWLAISGEICMWIFALQSSVHFINTQLRWRWVKY